jgi:HSP20 family molecular chaperone IbpA
MRRGVETLSDNADDPVDHRQSAERKYLRDKRDENKSGNKNGNAGTHYLRREFSYSNYEQALTLPEDVDRNGINAKVDNGVLHITLPRTHQAEKETKRIEVA